MPMPIRPNSDKGQSGVSDYLSILPSFFDNFDGLTSKAMAKSAFASDKEAEILYRVWNDSVVIKESDKVENKIYRLNNKVDNSDLLILKSAGLITEKNGEIGFTSKGASVIKTLVLGETNSFTKKSVKKPYSIILAEQKAPKRKSVLALASTMNLSDNIGLKKFSVYKSVSAQDIDIDENSIYIFNRRLISVWEYPKYSDKEYNIRVYFLNSNYVVLGFGGDRNADYENLTMYKKGESHDPWAAIMMAQDVIYQKIYGTSKCKEANPVDEKYPTSPINKSIPGKFSPYSETEKQIKEKEVIPENKKQLPTTPNIPTENQSVESIVKQLQDKTISPKNVKNMEALEKYIVSNNGVGNVGFGKLKELVLSPFATEDVLVIIIKGLTEAEQEYGENFNPLGLNVKMEALKKDIISNKNVPEDWGLEYLKKNPQALSLVQNEVLKEKYKDYVRSNLISKLFPAQKETVNIPSQKPKDIEKDVPKPTDDEEWEF